jgi:hypothetical protein
VAEVTLEEECLQLAAELIECDDAGRVRRIAAMIERAATEHLPGLPIVTGIILRDRDHYAWAEYVFRLATQVPAARGMALFELSVALGLQGRADRAVATLEELEAEHPLNPYQRRYYAIQLSRVGDLEGTDRQLQIAYEGEPATERECVALQQFSRYHQRFPAGEAVERCLALRDTFRFRDVAGMVADINAALAEGRGYSMIRLNDGEGSIIHLGIDDEAQYRELYTRSRREFHHWWFGHEERLYDPDFLQAEKDINDSILNASCLAADVTEHLRVRYRQGDVRNIPCLFNIVRKLEAIRDARPELARSMGLTDPVINQFLLFDGELERLLQSQDRIGLVSCHAALPGALQSKFGLSEVFFHKTPGEAAITQGVEPEPFAVWHGRIKDEVSRAVPGVLYLVAAGVMSKIYCDLIKRAGGVALDVGSVADIWMRAPTRTWWKQADDHILA